MSENNCDKPINPTSIGGQAVIEGVMMRGKNMYAMAVRREDGSLQIEKKQMKPFGSKRKLFKLPVFRGMAAFIDSLVLGTRITMASAEIAGEDISGSEPESKFDKFIEKKLGDKTNDFLIYASVFLSILLALGLFVLLPVWIGSFFKAFVPVWALGVIEGLVRIAIFLLYIILISYMKDIRRVFEYHGAEHKTINCYESGDELEIDNVMNHTRFHKRCGTSFLILVMLVSMVVFFFVRTDTIWLRFVSRLLLIPFVAGISYEIIKWAGKTDSKLVALVSYPGICLQKITTKEPDASQIEAAIAALKGVLEDEPE